MKTQGEKLNLQALKEAWKRSNDDTSGLLSDTWLRGALHRYHLESVPRPVRTSSRYEMAMGVGLSMAASLAIFFIVGAQGASSSYSDLNTTSLLNGDDTILLLDNK